MNGFVLPARVEFRRNGRLLARVNLRFHRQLLLLLLGFRHPSVQLLLPVFDHPAHLRHERRVVDVLDLREPRAVLRHVHVTNVAVKLVDERWGHPPALQVNLLQLRRQHVLPRQIHQLEKLEGAVRVGRGRHEHHPHRVRPRLGVAAVDHLFERFQIRLLVRRQLLVVQLVRLVNDDQALVQRVAVLLRPNPLHGLGGGIHVVVVKGFARSPLFPVQAVQEIRKRLVTYGPPAPRLSVAVGPVRPAGLARRRAYAAPPRVANHRVGVAQPRHVFRHVFPHVGARHPHNRVPRRVEVVGRHGHRRARLAGPRAVPQQNTLGLHRRLHVVLDELLARRQRRVHAVHHRPHFARSRQPGLHRRRETLVLRVVRGFREVRLQPLPHLLQGFNRHGRHVALRRLAAVFNDRVRRQRLARLFDRTLQRRGAEIRVLFFQVLFVLHARLLRLEHGVAASDAFVLARVDGLREKAVHRDFHAEPIELPHQFREHFLLQRVRVRVGLRNQLQHRGSFQTVLPQHFLRNRHAVTEHLQRPPQVFFKFQVFLPAIARAAADGLQLVRPVQRVEKVAVLYVKQIKPLLVLAVQHNEPDEFAVYVVGPVELPCRVLADLRGHHLVPTSVSGEENEGFRPQIRV